MVTIMLLRQANNYHRKKRRQGNNHRNGSPTIILFSSIAMTCVMHVFLEDGNEQGHGCLGWCLFDCGTTRPWLPGVVSYPSFLKMKMIMVVAGWRLFGCGTTRPWLPGLCRTLLSSPRNEGCPGLCRTLLSSPRNEDGRGWVASL